MRLGDAPAAREDQWVKEALNMVFLIWLCVMVLALSLLALSLLSFPVAAIAEISRSQQKGAGFFFRMGEIAIGFIFFAAYCKYPGILRISSSTVSWTMVCSSLLLGGVSLVSKYESPVALRFVLLGSVSLACLWYFKGAYQH